MHLLTCPWSIRTDAEIQELGLDCECLGGGRWNFVRFTLRQIMYICRQFYHMTKDIWKKWNLAEIK